MLLADLRVLDLTRLLPGPYCSMLLADYGAEVIKIEDPGTGDYLRDIEPLVDGTSAYYRALNQGKRSMTLDLKAPQGRELFLRLVESADVVMEGFRPGVMARLGLDHEALRGSNPRLVYASLSGFGATGPWRDKAGHDLTYLALSGVLSQLLPPTGPVPTLPGVQLADLAGALQAAFAIMMALWARERTGQGAFLDVAMLDAAMSLLPFAAARTMVQGQASPPGTTELTGALARYGVYGTRDGKRLALAAMEDKFWHAFCTATGHPEWLQESSQEQLKAELTACFSTRTREEWEHWAQGLDLCLEPVLELDEALRHPQIQARGLDGPGRIGLAVPWPGAGGRTEVRAKGQDTDAILGGMGLGAAAIADLHAQGVI